MMNQEKHTEPEWTIIRLLQWTTSYFKSKGIDSPRATAEIILAYSLGIKRIDLYLRHDQPLSKGELNLFKSLIKRRSRREPVAYITGCKEFWSMELEVSGDVLIPRPETECLVEEALSFLPKDGCCGPKKVFEMGTGSGSVIIAVASERPGHIFYASDISAAAARIAVKNAKRLGFGEKISFFCGDWFSPLKQGNNFFDVIISNPPYIRKSDIKNLQPEISRFEPARALDGGDDGLDKIRQIVANSPLFLKKQGILLLEIGYDQKDAVEGIIKETGGYDNVYFRKDYSGFDRVACARKSY